MLYTKQQEVQHASGSQQHLTTCAMTGNAHETGTISMSSLVDHVQCTVQVRQRMPETITTPA